MKKAIAILIMVVMVFNLSACSFVVGKTENVFSRIKGLIIPEEATEPSGESVPEESLPDATNPPVTTSPTVTTAPVVDKNGVQYVKVEPYLFIVTNPDRIIFDAPNGTYSKIFDEIGAYTIVEEAIDANGVKWGKLKSGVGWVMFDDNVLPELEMTFSSGVGAWRTQLDIYSDGTFVGTYSDSDMGDIDAEYPGGTVYYCEFRGKFTDVTIVDRYTLSLTLDYLNETTPTGETEYKNNMRFVYTTPYGMDDCEEFFLYLPRKEVTNLSDSFRSWISNALVAYKDSTDRYVLHNIETDFAFVENIY